MTWLFSFGLLSHDYLCINPMKISWIVLLLASLMTACSGEGLSPERKACLENAKTEAERIYTVFQQYPPLNAAEIPMLNVMIVTEEYEE